jgi:hypothetical protein
MNIAFTLTFEVGPKTAAFIERVIFNATSDIKGAIMSTQAELAAQLSTIGDQLDKASTELVNEIQALTDAVKTAGNTTPEVDASLARLTAIAQKLDDMNVDVPAPTPAPAP